MDRNNEYVKICPRCINIKEDLNNVSGLFPKIGIFYRGFLTEEDDRCPHCHQKNTIDSIITLYELEVIALCSVYDRQTLNEMIELKQKNPKQFQMEFKLLEGECEKIENINCIQKTFGENKKENISIKFCPNCNETGENIRILPKTSKCRFLKFSDFDKGFIYWFDEESNSDECPCCGTKGMTDSVITRKEFDIIKEVSNSNRQLLELMIELKQKDPIEFQLKFGQFEFQLQQKQLLKKQEADLKKQQEEIKKQKEEENKPKCPHCKSADIKKISFTNRTVSIVFWGPFSKKINKSFQCRDCGYTW